MKPKRVDEVVALIAQPEFQSWWAELQRARAELKTAQQRHEEMLSEASLTEFKAELLQKNAIDTLYRAGECEDAAATMMFEGTELENRSFRAVSDFEEQRFKVSDFWYRLGTAEKLLDERRETLASARTKKSETDLKGAEQAHRVAREEYDRETARKNQLWEEVERIWAKSAEANLLVAEQRVRAKRIRREAEALFALAEERKQQSGILRAEAERASALCQTTETALRAVLDQAQREFECSAGTDFLYFRYKDDQKLALCVSLIEDRDNYNVVLLPLSIHRVGRQRGVAFLEPSFGLPSPESNFKLGEMR
ncbi:MAG TPA: hypothetical protein VEM39_03060 [Myxococcaceae bacterium]|nr:hypothetical protein [Myxococcaceae bacterium]